MVSFIEVTFFISTVSSIAAILPVFYRLIQDYREKRQRLRAAEEEDFRAAMDSSRLSEMSEFIEGKIGKFTILQYSKGADVRRRVDSYLAEITEFLERPRDVPRPAVQQWPPLQQNLTAQLDDEFEPMLREARFGEPWNALARLRRHIELKLMERAKHAQLPVPRVASAGRLLDLLWKAGLVPEQAISPLQESIYLANRGIHGHVISSQEAEGAIYAAAGALSEILKPR